MLVTVCNLNSHLEIIITNYHGFKGPTGRVRRGGLASGAIKIILKLFLCY
jgi:hypothetical protein